MAEVDASASAARMRFMSSCSGKPKAIRLPQGVIQCVTDFTLILAGPVLGSFLFQNTESLVKNLCFWCLLALFSVLLTASHGGYCVRRETHAKARYGISSNCFLGTSVGMLTLAVLLGHSHILFRQWVVFDVMLTPLLLIAARTLLTPNLAELIRHTSEEGPLIVCYDALPRDIDKAIATKALPRNIAGILFLAEPCRPDRAHPWPELPDLTALREKLRSRNIKDVVFVYHPALDGLRAGLDQALWQEVLTYPARIWLAFDVPANLPDMLRGTSGGCRLVPIVTDELLDSRNLVKRVFDIVASCLLLALAALPMAVCALLVRATSPGPIIFSQLRTGAQGRQFRVLKFRTMSNDPERAFFQASRDDRQITPIGKILRRTSLDEVPQLLNVIRGDMSLVGPRPHAPETQVEGISFENAVQLYQIRHRVKPGITGLAQIRGLRGATPLLQNLEQRLASDLEYITSWSLWLDLSILIQTIPAVLIQTNAY